LGLILIFVLSILDVDVCSVFCVALLLFFATLKLIVQLCTYSVVIIAMMLNDPEETKLVGVIETWKMYPNNYEKTEKENYLGNEK
jgi:hypothetical protein